MRRIMHVCWRDEQKRIVISTPQEAFRNRDLIDRNTLTKTAWETQGIDGSPVSVVSLKDIKDTPSFGVMPKGAYCAIVTKSELNKLVQALDVMGDRMADREGYSAGEEYWDLKEKLESLEMKRQKPFGQMMNDAHTKAAAGQAAAHGKHKEDELEI